MKKLTILLIAMVYLTMMSCKQNNEQIHDEHDHDHEALVHDHDNEEHEEHEHEDSDDHDHDEHEEHEHNYKTGQIKLETFNQIIKTSGELKATNSGEVVLTAPNSGIVHYADNQITEGCFVEAGQPVFNISGGNLVDNNINIKYNQSKSSYDKAKSDYERAEQLVKQNIISEREYEQLKMVYLNTKSEYDVISKSAKGAGAVTVQQKSYIKEFYVEEGQYVESGEKLACVIKKGKLHLVAEVSQKYFKDLSDIESATFLLSNNSKIYDTKDLNGRLLSYGKAINSRSFYLPVVFEIDYQKDLIPGSFVQVFLKGKKTDNCIVIPKTALIEEQGNYFVFVEEGHDKFHKHPVKLGNEDGKRVVVLEGIEANETIVTENAYAVKLAGMSGALPTHSHNH